METIWFWAAGVVTATVVLIHVIFGGKIFIRPFLANDIPKEQKWMAYFVWHIASVTFVFMAAGFIGAAIWSEHTDYAIISTAFAAVMVATALFVCVKGSISPKTLPAIPLFSIVTVLGLFGLLT